MAGRKYIHKKKKRVINQNKELYYGKFLKAVDEGNEEVINEVMVKKGILQQHFGYGRNTMLHIVAEKGTVATAIKIIELGADVNVKAQFRETPIFHAINNSLEMVECLLDNGAEINALNINGEIPLFRAIEKNNSKIVRFLLNKGADVNFRKQRVEVKVCSRGCSNKKEFPKYYGMTPLHKACYVGNMEIFKILLEFGANKNALDEERNSVLHFAVLRNCLEIVDFLLKDGFDVNKKNSYEYTPLLFAVQRHCLSLEMLETLLEHGVNINAKAKGYTIVHLASYTGQYKLMEVLRELQADYKPTRNLNVKVMENDIFKYSTFNDYNDHRHLTISFIALKDNEVESTNSYFSLIDDDDEELNVRNRVINYFKKSQQELSKMKSTKFEKTTIPVYNFLTSNFYAAVQFAKNENVKKVFESGKYKKTYPCYEFFLEDRFKRIEDFKKYVEKTEEFFNNYEKKKLPAVVIRMILSHLRWIDFKVMAKILSPEEK